MVEEKVPIWTVHQSAYPWLECHDLHSYLGRLRLPLVGYLTDPYQCLLSGCGDYLAFFLCDIFMIFLILVVGVKRTKSVDGKVRSVAECIEPFVAYSCSMLAFGQRKGI